MLCKIFADFFKPGLIGIRSVAARRAVNVNIHKPGQSNHAAHIAAIALYNADCLDFAALYFDIGNFLFKKFIIKANIF